MIKKILLLAKAHKVITVIVMLAAFGIGSYVSSATKGSAAARYVFAQVERGTLIVSFSGTGQVSAANQVDITPKVSGTVVYVGVRNNEEVKVGTLIAQIDARDAQKSVRDAESSLESAKLSLEKLKAPADQLSMLQSENALAQARESKQKAEDNLAKAYEDGFNTVTNAFLALPSVVTGLHDIFFSSDIAQYQNTVWNIDWYANQISSWDDGKASIAKADVSHKQTDARTAYQATLDRYKATTRDSDTATIESLISDTYNTTRMIADAVKTSDNYIDFVQDLMQQHNIVLPSRMLTHQSSIDSYTGTTNGQLSSLLSAKRAIEDAKQAIVAADRSIAEKTESFAKLKDGADPLDIQSQELSLKQRENALTDAKEKLADYFVRAPFNGVIAKVNVEKGDSASGGSAMATLVTREKLAEISLNEVDVAQVEVGQKATLTFDAVLDLTITGSVAEIDAIGTVSQGVVTYNVKIAFDTQDARIKPGMSVSASIITDANPDVLLVPNSAVKSQGETSYVEMPGTLDAASAATASASGVVLTAALERKGVTIGASNDTFTEVTDGLKEGDRVLTRTIQPSAAAPATSAQSGLRIGGLTGGGGTRGGN